MSRLNYNKWDNLQVRFCGPPAPPPTVGVAPACMDADGRASPLQLSDDSDIEVHPNVDKKSMIRCVLLLAPARASTRPDDSTCYSWKQRDIHEKREQRKLKLKQFEVEVPMNASLIARMDSLVSSTQADGAQFISNEVQRLKAALPYKYEDKKFVEGEQPTEDHMIVSLLSQVINEAQKKEQAAGKGEAGRDARLVAELEWHKKRLLDRQEEIKKETAEIEAEQKKWITSDDIHTGWDSKTVRPCLPSFRSQCSTSLVAYTGRRPPQLVSKAPTAQPVTAPPAASSSKPRQTKTETVVETLNSPAVQAAAQTEVRSVHEPPAYGRLCSRAPRGRPLSRPGFHTDAPSLFAHRTRATLRTRQMSLP